MLNSLSFSVGNLWFPCLFAVVVIGLLLRLAALAVLVSVQRHAQGRKPLWPRSGTHQRELGQPLGGRA